MRIDQEQPRLSESGKRLRPPAVGFLGKVLAVAAGVIVLVAALVFSLVLVAVVASVGVVAWAYLWWRTRDLRKQVRERRRDGPKDVTVIEGEFSRAPRSHDDTEG
jgi:O-antigen/teichoic acid export membrane protein